jgi:dihydrofolate reductase
MVSLDGWFAGPDGNIDWHTVDDEFNDFAVAQLAAADALVFGRVTYELMADYWPTPEARADDPLIAEQMNALPKIVFSRTLAQAHWNPTRLVREHLAEEVQRLKRTFDKDLLIFGSANLAASLLRECLIDELRLMVSPLVLGRGLPLSQDRNSKLDLQLLQARPFRNGNVLLTYQPNYQPT